MKFLKQLKHMNEIKYMASWLEEDVVTNDISKLPREPVWQYWNGKLKRGQEPPKRVIILTTGLLYKWEDFKKVRIKR